MSQALYDLPEGWEWVNLETIFDTKGFAVGKIPKADFGNEGSIPIIDQSQNFIAGYTETSDAYVGRLPVIVYGDHTNSLKYIDFKFICGADGTKVLSPKESVYARYAYYVLERFKPETLGYRRHFPILKTVRFPLPPLAEQTRIVEKLDAVLSRIDTAIDELQQSLALVDAMFKSGLDGVMSDVISDVGLRCVNDFIVSIQTGTTPPTKDKQYFENGDVNWFAPSDFGEKAILDNAIKKINKLALIEGKARSFSAGTVMLVAIGATIGKVGLLAAQACSNQQVTGMLFDKNIVPKYAYYWFLFNKKQILSNASKATLPIINQKGIKELSFACPSVKKQNEIIAFLDGLEDKTTQLKTELIAKIGMLNQLKASVLDGAFRGETIKRIAL